MTRKKSNVKALALAVTCAILAGGYSGLNPVYAEGTLHKDTSSGTVTTVKSTATPSATEEITQITVGGVTLGDFGTSGGTGRIEASNVKISNNLTVSNTLKVSNTLNVGDNITISGSDGKLTVNAARINGNNTVTGILRAGEIKGLDIIDPSNSTIVTGQAELKINDATFKDGGKVAANSLELGTGADAIGDVATAIKAKASQTDFDALNATVNDTTNGLVKKVNDNATALAAKANTADVYSKTDADVKFETIENVNGVKTRVQSVENKTQGITHADANSTVMNGVTFKNGLVSAATIQTKNIGTENMAVTTGLAVGDPNGKLVSAINGNLAASDALTVGNQTEFVNATNGNLTATGKLQTNNDTISNGTTEVKVSEIASDHTLLATVNTNVAGIARDATNSTTTIEGKLKVKSDGTVTINEGDANQVMINNNGIKVGTGSTYISGDAVYTGGADYNNAKAGMKNDGSLKAAGGNFTVDGSGWITSKVSGNEGTLGGDKLELKDAAGTSSADIESGYVRIEKNGKVTTIDGDELKTGSMKTDNIEEATTDAGVTVDGVVLKDGGVNASEMSVTGATGSLNVKDIGGTSTMIYTKAADGTNTIWIDPATGNISTNGTLQVGGGVAGTQPSVTIDGATGSIKVGQNDTEKFAVDGTTGNVKTEGSLEVADNATVGGNLGVTGNATVGGTLGVTGDATFGGNIKGQSLNIGATGNEFTVDTVGNINANAITTSDSTVNKIGGVTLSGSDIKGRNLELTGTLQANKYEAKDIEATDSISVGATKLTDGKLDLGSNGTIDFGANELNDAQVGNINNVINTGGVVNAANGSVIGGVTFNAGNVTGVNDLTANGNITAKKVTAEEITDGTATLKNGSLTGLTSANISGTTIDSTGINTNKLTVGTGLNATTIDESNGIVSAKGEIGAVKFTGAGKLENVTSIDGVSVAQNSGSANGGLTFGGNAVIGATGTPFQSTGFKVDDDGDVEGKTFTTAADGSGNKSILASGSLTIDANNTWTKDAGIIASNVKVGSNELKNDGLHVGTNTTVKDGELTVGTGNTWSMANGITASKAGINGVTIGETEGKATFNNAGNTTEINGNKITTGTITADELNVDKISLGKGTDKNITIGSNGDVTTKGEIKITDAAGNVMTKLAKDSATFGNDAANQTVIDKGTIKAQAEDTNHQKAGLKFDENGLTVSGQNAEGKISSFSFNAETGANTFTGQDNTTTTINGSKITSTNGTATGVLDGSNLTLTNGAKSTALEAGKATYTGKAGSSSKQGTTTTIDGGVITTDTLNVERIQLGEKIVDQRTGEVIGSGVTLAADGGFSAAGGNFKVTGGTSASKGSITNIVDDTASGNGKTTFETKKTGAGMSYEKGGVTSNVSVGNNNANVSAGAGSIDVTNESITSKVGTDASSTIAADKIVDKVGNNSVTTDADGTTFNNGTNKTNINGGTITTGKLITDELVITGQGEAAGAGTGSIAFGGNGTIKSDIKDGAKNTNFTTDIDGVTTTVTDGTNTTTNEVAAAGNTNTVTDGTATSKNTQTATSIGGVVTNGTVKIAQTLDGANGNITNEVTDKDGKSSKLVQNGTGLEYTDSTKADNATRINSSDVSIGSATDDSKRINLSDLGQIDDLDPELSARDEFKNNPTAVGGINAEAAVRREEVARLDNRIDDVNDRVNKVGAMAAAIASLKSIGYDPQAPSEFSVGLGQYKGETGVALGFFHYPNKNFMINVSLSTAGGETMGGIGATWRFGHKSPQKLLDEQRAAQAKKELAAAEKYKAAAQLAKEAQERAEYAAKLARQAQVSADNAKAAADATQAKHFN